MHIFLDELDDNYIYLFNFLAINLPEIYIWKYTFFSWLGFKLNDVIIRLYLNNT